MTTLGLLLDAITLAHVLDRIGKLGLSLKGESPESQDRRATEGHQEMKIRHAK
jgi:hypothetical protein